MKAAEQLAGQMVVVPDDPARLTAQPPTTRLVDHVARYGELPSRFDGLIESVEQAGLRGRGGAGFPTGIKMAAVASRRSASAVVANGTEGEPLSTKDKSLLVHAPHLVLDGAMAAARAVKAREVVVCIERGHPDVRAALDHTIAERHLHRIDRTEIRIAETPPRYVAGEESALVHWINGGEAKPTFVPPRPFERGVGGRPTLVDNVETLAHVGLIARFGAAWYRGLGTEADPGTRLLTVSGAVARAGVYEVPAGYPLVDALRAAGGELAGIDAVLVGGYFGTWIPNSQIGGVRFDGESLAGVGSSPGCGVVFALPAGACGLTEAARVTRWLADQNAGQCGPCVFGLDAIAKAMASLVEGGHHVAGAYDEVQRLTRLVAGRGACRHPDGAVRFVQSTLRTFGEHAADHARRGPCRVEHVWLPTPPTGGWR